MALGAALALTAGPAAAYAQEERADTAPVAATPIDPEARRLAERGLAHFEAGRYREALDDFQAAYEITRAPALLYNLAQAQRLKGDCAAALALYRRFLAEQPAGNIRALTEAHIAETERCAAESRPAPAPPPALPRPAGSPPARAPSSAADTSLLARTGEPSRPTFSRRQRVGVGVGVAAVVLGAAAGVYGWRAHQASDDVTAIHDRMEPWGYYAMERERTGVHSERTAIALGAGAVVSAALSLWLLLRR